jgi:hypothetical protein
LHCLHYAPPRHARPWPAVFSCFNDPRAPPSTDLLLSLRLLGDGVSMGLRGDARINSEGLGFSVEAGRCRLTVANPCQNPCFERTYDFSALTLNTLYRFQVLLSNSPCAATWRTCGRNWTRTSSWWRTRRSLVENRCGSGGERRFCVFEEAYRDGVEGSGILSRT